MGSVSSQGWSGSAAVTMKARGSWRPRCLCANCGTVGGARRKTTLRVHLMLEIERVGDCERTDVDAVERVLKLQCVLIHSWTWKPPQERVWSGYWLGGVDGCRLQAGERRRCRRHHRLVLWYPFLCGIFIFLLRRSGVLEPSGWWLCL